jgi:hypothetical protein
MWKYKLRREYELERRVLQAFSRWKCILDEGGKNGKLTEMEDAGVSHG